jgi:hypothetical protein
MRVYKERQSVVSFKVTAEVRRTIEAMAARLTLERERRHTLTDVIEEAVRVLAKRVMR